MANENETIADIIAEMRNYIAECNRGLTAHTRYGNGAFPLDDLVKRIEAAHNREREATCDKSSQVGDAAKMREALEAIRDLARKTKSRSENINVALTTIFWYAHGALVETEEGGAE